MIPFYKNLELNWPTGAFFNLTELIEGYQWMHDNADLILPHHDWEFFERHPTGSVGSRRGTFRKAGHVGVPPLSTRWQFELIDLSRPLTEETVFALLGDSVAGDEWAKYRSVQIGYDQDWETSNSLVCHFSVSDHVGTHIDAPAHCLESGGRLESVDISRLMGEAVCLDLRRGDGDYGYTARDFSEGQPGIEPEDIVLIY